MILLGLGTVLTVVFIALLFAGRKYSGMVESLPDEDFPLKSLYVAGIVLLKRFTIRGKIAGKVKEFNTIYYGVKFGEYYAFMVWAQSITLGLLILTVCLLLCGVMKDMAVLFLLIGVGGSVYTVLYFIGHTKQLVDRRREECEFEFPNAISKMALLVNSGVILHDAWNLVAFGKEGVFYRMMREACERMDNGVSDSVAIHDFGVQSNSGDVKKFATALIQNAERGGGELSIFLANQSSELWNHRRQIALQRGEKAASALLAPIALMLVGVMLIIIAAAMQSFSG